MSAHLKFIENLFSNHLESYHQQKVKDPANRAEILKAMGLRLSSQKVEDASKPKIAELDPALIFNETLEPIALMDFIKLQVQLGDNLYAEMYNHLRRVIKVLEPEFMMHSHGELISGRHSQTLRFFERCEESTYTLITENDYVGALWAFYFLSHQYFSAEELSEKIGEESLLRDTFNAFDITTANIAGKTHQPFKSSIITQGGSAIDHISLSLWGFGPCWIAQNMLSLIPKLGIRTTEQQLEMFNNQWQSSFNIEHPLPNDMQSKSTEERLDLTTYAVIQDWGLRPKTEVLDFLKESNMYRDHPWNRALTHLVTIQSVLDLLGHKYGRELVGKILLN